MAAAGEHDDYRLLGKAETGRYRPRGNLAQTG
jgi:hypothetical protein